MNLGRRAQIQAHDASSVIPTTSVPDAPRPRIQSTATKNTNFIILFLVGVLLFATAGRETATVEQTTNTVIAAPPAPAITAIPAPPIIPPQPPTRDETAPKFDQSPSDGTSDATAALEAANKEMRAELEAINSALLAATLSPTASPRAPELPPVPTDPASSALIPLPDIADIPSYTGYTFWSSDFHISPIQDLKSIFVPLGHTVIDKSLSGHCKIVKPPTCQNDLKVINTNNGITLGTNGRSAKACPNQLKRQFFESYKNDNQMKNVDAFLCNHAIGECELFMAFGRPLVAIASTRYEIGRYGATQWNEWNKNLRDIAADGRNVVAANNRYDAEYIKYFTGLKDVPVIPNYCGYTGVSYKPTRPEILIGPGRGISDNMHSELQRSAGSALFKFKKIRDLYPHFEYSDLAAHPAIVLIPYQVSLMSVFEYYRMNIPMFAPSPRLLAEWQKKYRVMSELTWDMVFGQAKGKSNIDQYPGGEYPYDPNDQMNIDAIAYWIKWADFYEWPFIETYDSFDDLMDKLGKADLPGTSEKMVAENVRMKAELEETWKRNFHRMFQGVEPAASQGGKGFEESYNDGMQKHYQITAGECGMGDDVHGGDVSHVVI